MRGASPSWDCSASLRATTPCGNNEQDGVDLLS
jgi:hypothetical protein